MKHKLSELIDVQKNQHLLDSFCDAVGISAAIIDLKGKVLVGARWQKICTDFHRKNHATRARCTESDTVLAGALQKGEQLSLYQCQNGLTDAASPIIIEGEHIANAFVGQFLLEPPDMDFFRSQAAEFGFEEKAYLQAVKKVPIIAKERLPFILRFLSSFAENIGAMALHSLRQSAYETALRESEKRFKETVDLLPTIVCEYDINGRFTYVNSYGLETFGYSEADLKKGLYASQVFPAREEKKFKERFLSLLAGEKQTPGEYQLKCKDGSTIDVIATSAPIYSNNEIVGLRSCVTPITELKRTQEALLESEKKYKELADSLPQIIFETDEVGHITFVNLDAFRVFGYSKEDLNKGFNALDMLVPEDRESAMKNIQEVLNGKTSGGFEYTAQRKDGSTFSILIHSTRIMRHGKPVGLRGIIIDLTERKQAEKERSKLEKRLQRAEKMEAIGTLAGGVAHDLNNVLSGIVSYPDLMLMQLPEDSPLITPIMTIKHAGEKSAAIVQDLLTLARRGVTHSEVVFLNDIVKRYLESPEYDRLISYHPDIEVVANFGENLLNILGSPIHLSKTVMNLVSNAAEAMTSGGKIIITTENRYIDKPIGSYDEVQEGDYVVLTVSDSGVGISQRDMGRIFEPFYTKKKMGRSGTGLGMSVVWGTVKDHKGYIDVQSLEGQGSVFTLYFPATRKGFDKKISRIAIQDLHGNGEAILVVDDVKEQREIVSNILSSLGYSVAAVSSGDAAVRYLKNKPVDLLILDMIMDPGIDGLDTYKRVLERYPKQKAIITSGFSETGRVKKAQRLGASQYIKKPYTLEEIGIAVKKELNKKEHHRSI